MAGGSPWVVGVDETITGGIVGIGGFVVGWTMTGAVVVVDVEVVDVVTDGGSDDVGVVGATMTGPVVVGAVVGVTIEADTAENKHTTAPAAMTPGANVKSRPTMIHAGTRPPGRQRNRR